jgi:peptide/nickel transport system substrate-binding protein
MIMLALAGCSKGPGKNIPFDPTKPQYGDYYIAASIGDASYLNPVLATDSASGQINGLIYNGLVKYDKNIKIVGDLATGWDVAQDGMTITFHLRKNVKWHDGYPFTAEDVKFTYEKLIDPTVKTPYSGDFTLIKKLTTPDPYTVMVVYKQPFSPALESWGMGIIPKHIFEKGDFDTNPANRNPVGTGPFRFVEWKTDEKIVLEANPLYFEGKPYINRYIFRIIPDQSVEFLELRNESIDESSLTPDQWKAYNEFFREYNKFRYPSFSYTYMGFNLKKELFSDKRVRRAIASAINKDAIINGVLLGMGKAATGPFPPDSWACNRDVRDVKYDPASALASLKALGWKTGESGYLEKDGKTFEFAIITNQGNKLRSLSAEIIQSQLKKIGVKMNIRIIEWSAFIHNFIDKKDFDAVILGWSVSRDPDQYSIWSSKQSGEGQYNFISYSNPEVDRLLDAGRKSFDIEKRKSVYNRIHAILADDLPYIFLYYPDALVAVHKRFVGPEVSPIGLGWNFYKWWVPLQQQRYKM